MYNRIHNHHDTFEKQSTFFCRSKIRAEFLEAEAELSGSEVGSDDEEGDVDQDVMEEEEGDREQFDDEDLRDQVRRGIGSSYI